MGYKYRLDIIERKKFIIYGMKKYEYAKNTSEFEKLAMHIGDDLSICIANKPTDHSVCSFVMSKSDEHGKSSVVRHELDVIQVGAIIEALSSVLCDMIKKKENK